MQKLPIPEAVLSTHTIIFGMTGAGKSSVARFLVEHLLDDAKAHPLLDAMPMTIIDPKGDWWGLRSSADGKGKGYPMVIFGGDHGDLPLAARSGAAVAEAVLSGVYTSLIDMSLLTLGERTTFFLDFATAYYRARMPRRLIIDEAHNFCPKGKIPDPQVSKMLHISNTIASEGRGRGIVMIAASQRPQKVHNDFSSSCSTLIAMKVLHPADRAAYKDWLDGAGDKAAAAEILGSAAALPKGTGWVWCVGDEPFGPTKVPFPKYRTYDSFKPQSASMVVTGKALPDLDKLRTQMAGYLEEQKQNDPADLKRRIRELEDKLSVATGAIPPPLPPPGLTPEQHRSIVEQSVQQAAFDAATHAWEKGFDAGAKKAHLEETQRIVSYADEIADMIRANVPRLSPTHIDPYPGMAEKYQWKEVSVAIGRPKPKKGDTVSDATIATAVRKADTGLTSGQQKILDALLWLLDAGYDLPPREQLSAIACYRGGAYRRALGELKTRGLVAFPEEGFVRITPEGRSLASLDPNGSTAPQRWRLAMKTEKQRQMFDELLGNGALSRDDLSRRVSYSGGAYRRALGEMKTLGAVHYPEDGMVALTEMVHG